MKEFYMVYVQWNDSPRLQHVDIESASKEAERQAKSQGKPTFVLKAVRMCEHVEHPIEWTELTDTSELSCEE